MSERTKELTALAKAVRNGRVDAQALVDLAYEMYGENTRMRKQLLKLGEVQDAHTLSRIRKAIRLEEAREGLRDADLFQVRKAFEAGQRSGGRVTLGSEEGDDE